MASDSRIQDDGHTHQYTDNLPKDITMARKVLEMYSGIAPDRVIPHILAIHTKASLHPDPYPCITSFRFLQFHISTHPLYTHILSRLTAPSNQTILDLGTCFGQDLRILAHDGANPQNLFGADLHPEFIDLGFKLFNDRDRLGRNLVAGDIFTAESGSELGNLKGKMDMISVTAFLHLFSREDQVKACEEMIGFLKPVCERENDRQLVFGRQSGTTRPGVRIRKEGEVKWGRRELFLHDVESFRELWEEVGRRTGTKWEVRGELRKMGCAGVKGIEDPETARLLVFSVWRLDKGARREVGKVNGS